MWLTRQLSQGEGLRMRNGLVNSGEGFSIQGEKEYRSPEQVAPYGISSRAAGGRQAVMLGGYCTGVVAGEDGSIHEGEVRLYSAGGAEILLKNNGDVVINGQVFAAPAGEDA